MTNRGSEKVGVEGMRSRMNGGPSPLGQLPATGARKAWTARCRVSDSRWHSLVRSSAVIWEESHSSFFCRFQQLMTMSSEGKTLKCKENLEMKNGMFVVGISDGKCKH